MLKSFIQAMYHSMDIDVGDELSKNKDYKRLEKKMVDSAFVKSLSEEQKVMFEEYCELENEAEGISDEIVFARGFKIGLHAGLECAAPKELIKE